MRRLRAAQLLAIGEGMPRRDRDLLQMVGRLQLVTHAQAATLLLASAPADSSPASAARAARRLLQQLTDLGLLARLDRRIGGLRAGSAGFVYYLGPAGQRLLAYWRGHGLTRGRFRPEPGSRYVRHRLAVSQLYVDAWLADQRGELELLSFDAEPDCWRGYADNFAGEHLIKPDAYLRIGLGAYEDRFFIEVDLGTESRSVVASKLRAFLAYYRSGEEQAEHGVYPRVLLLTSSENRRAVLVDLCARLPADDWGLFTLNTLANFVAVITGAAHDERLAGDRS